VIVISAVGVQRPLQIIRYLQEVAQQPFAVGLDTLLGQPPLTLAKVLYLSLQAQSAIAPRLKLFL
jgi:hypothetical protein